MSRFISASVSAIALVLLCLFQSGCGVSSGSTVVKPTNQVAVVAHTPNSGFNRITVTVKVCVPGTSQCADIDNVMIDTGSVGLRIQAAALAPFALPLPTMKYADGNQLGECLHFGGGDAWGMVDKADISLGSMRTAGMSIQVIGADATRQPVECPSAKPTSNGTLGIGIGDLDCSGACTMPAYYGSKLGYLSQFYSCTDNSCVAIKGSIDTAYRLPNPTATMDGGAYNGAIIELPTINGETADQIAGTLTFGVNTNQLNTLSNPVIAALDALGNVTTTYNGISFGNSYIDSGTATYTVPDSTLTLCKAPKPLGSFCVSPTLNATAVIAGLDGTPHDVPFKIGMYPLSGVAAGAADYGSYDSPTFVWGAPFFFGKRVAVVRRGQVVSGITQAGPLYAWQDASL